MTEWWNVFDALETPIVVVTTGGYIWLAGKIKAAAGTGVVLIMLGLTIVLMLTTAAQGLSALHRQRECAQIIRTSDDPRLVGACIPWDQAE